ncbi:MAG: cell division protein FtsB [Burkholderiaceae bacterium]|nr:cell division protein FtsB [Burkholderiaceae bacterium]
MKLLVGGLAVLLALIQYPLWLGKGGWLRVWELDRQVSAQLASNARLSERNAALEGEVRDLAAGSLAVEERARYDLGMVRPDEIFVQINEGRAQRIKPSAPDPGPGQTRTASAHAPPLSAAR